MKTGLGSASEASVLIATENNMDVLRQHSTFPRNRTSAPARPLPRKTRGRHRTSSAGLRGCAFGRAREATPDLAEKRGHFQNAPRAARNRRRANAPDVSFPQ